MVFDHLLYRHWTAFTGEKRSHVFVVSAALGTDVRDLTPKSAVGDAETPTFSLGGPLGYAWAPDSSEIAYVTNLDEVKAASTNNDVFTLRLDEKGAKAEKISTSPGSDDGPAYSPDGKWLAFRSQARAGFESDRFRLMVMDRKGGSTKELMPQFDRWVDEFVWAPDSRSVYFASAQSGTEQVYQYSVSDKTLTLRTKGVRGDESRDADLARDLSLSQGAEYGGLAMNSDGHSLIATMMSARAPSEVVVLKVDDREERDDTGNHLARKAFDGSGSSVREVLFEERRLTHLNDSVLGQLELPKMEEYQFTGAENAKVEGFVVRPPGFDPKKKYPVKFLIHGGPQGAWGDAWSYRWNPELMAASGYVVVMVNPRGSTGYGQKFIDEVSGDWGGRAYVDLMKGLDAAESKFPFIDKTRECALGASYGGYMANWVLTHTDRFKCIVTHDGMYNPASAYGDTEELWFNEWEFRRAGDLASGKQAQPWKYAAGPAAEDPFRKWSPMLHIQDAKTPTLVIHSQLDYRLDVSEGYQLFTALQRLGVPSKMLYFPDEGHWVQKPQNSQLWNATVSDWCDRWTRSGPYAGK
ncbi:alpha/beta hydrolase family protein [Granulicella sibirica]|nr:S9 family peptidase [Granulicella sibirica]